MKPPQDDRIFPSTRIISAVIVPILALAFVILYFFPQLSPQRFAFPVQPDLQALYIGAGYIGGAYLFLHAVFGRRPHTGTGWHRVAAGFPAVTTFTVSMLLATIVHWSRFDLRRFPFQLWLVLYIVTPMLVPWMWLRNRVTDPGTPEPDDVIVPTRVRSAVRALGIGLTAFSVLSFIFPQLLIAWWPWNLTAFSARLLAGWGALIGVGNLAIAGDPRWSAWRVGVESIALWHLLFLIGAVFYRQEFNGGSLVNWYLLSVVAVLILMAALYVSMEAQRRQRTALPQVAK